MLEAEQIAALIRNRGAAVNVDTGDTSASACFLIFAGGTPRSAGKTAYIGVHSAIGPNGREVISSLAVTTLVARDAASYGTAPSIVGRIVTTEPANITWLTESDLNLMGVTIRDSTAERAWARTRTRTRDGEDTEYRGNYICAQGVTGLSIRIVDKTSPQKRAVFSFGSTASAPNLPAGSFMMQGRVDLDGGSLNLDSVSWLVQPPGWVMVSLVGTSTDHGESFRGKVTGG